MNADSVHTVEVTARDRAGIPLARYEFLVSDQVAGDDRFAVDVQPIDDPRTDVERTLSDPDPWMILHLTGQLKSMRIADGATVLALDPLTRARGVYCHDELLTDAEVEVNEALVGIFGEQVKENPVEADALPT